MIEFLQYMITTMYYKIMLVLHFLFILIAHDLLVKYQ